MAYVLIRRRPGLGQWGPPCDPFWSEMNGGCSDELGRYLAPTAGGTIKPLEEFNAGAPARSGEAPPAAGFDFMAWIKRNQAPIQVGAGVLLVLAVFKAVRR